jgi:demethylmenaquinone methyltransferase/2-methoxy-6-polyprenyl-1,4-benzoquinol methylase
MHAAPGTHRSSEPSPLRSNLGRDDVSAMFDRIAHRYDFLNTLLSAGTDHRWRRAAIERLASKRPKAILDVAAGTGDMILECLRLKPLRVAGVDPSGSMLEVAREKLASRSRPLPVELVKASAEHIPFPAGTFDAVTCAFGVRNFTQLEDGLAEFFRVLRPGGTALILEFSRPSGIPAERLYRLYFTRILPFVGGLVSGDRRAYQYLPDTVEAFPSGAEFLGYLREAGFTDLHAEPLSYGIATIYTGTKPEAVWR